MSQFSTYAIYGGGEGQGGLNLPLPVPFNPGSRPIFVPSHLLAFFRLRNAAQCCVIFSFFFRFPPPLLPPPVHLRPPFLPVSCSPVLLPPTLLDVLKSLTYKRCLNNNIPYFIHIFFSDIRGNKLSLSDLKVILAGKRKLSYL